MINIALGSATKVHLATERCYHRQSDLTMNTEQHRLEIMIGLKWILF